jgi:Sulfotransferase domain
VVVLKHIRFWSGTVRRRIVQQITSRFYINPDADLDKSIVVAGTARSGTTWLGDLIASQVPCRILFEPFHPELVPEYRGFHYFQYMRPGMENLKFQGFAQKVFTGEIRNRWIDRQNERMFSQVRLVKEIRANLALKWLHDHFPEVPIVLLIRHPCAVVCSRMELGWATDTDIKPLLSQPELIEDHLLPYMDLIKSAKTMEEKHTIIWCVSNLVPLKQFNPGEVKIMYYEHLCTQPENELPALFEFIGRTYNKPVIGIINQPSQTTKVTSAVVRGMDKIENWKKKLRPSQIDSVLRTVEAFGMSHLYGDSVSPLGHNAG